MPLLDRYRGRRRLDLVYYRDPQRLDHLFDAFYTTKSQGMGMGLTISRSIIELTAQGCGGTQTRRGVPYFSSRCQLVIRGPRKGNRRCGQIEAEGNSRLSQNGEGVFQSEQVQFWLPVNARRLAFRVTGNS